MNVVIIRFIIRFFLAVFFLLAITIFFLKTDKPTLRDTHNYYEAKIISLYQQDPNHEINIVQNGKNVRVRITDLINDPYIIQAKERATKDITSSTKIAVIISAILTLSLIIYFIIKGSQLGKSKHIRGGSIVKPKDLIKMVKNYNRSTLLKSRISYLIQKVLKTATPPKPYKPYNIANKIPYPAYTETQHTLITGGSGTGKTQLLKHLLSQIKARGDRAIVYDKMGSFIPHFYEESKGDIILNPFDKRSPIWSIFNEVEETLQLDSIASALMPITKNISDPFWVQASRTIFTSVAGKMKEKGETSNKKLVDNLLKIDLSGIATIIKGTPAQAIIDERSPKTALSVMSVLSTYLSSLKYLKDAKFNKDGELQRTFSIRNWVKDDHNSSFLFISSRGDQHESLKPLISTWLEIAINSLLSIKQDRNRKIWIILDELPSLHMLPSLNSGIAESRQFGGCFVLSLQLMAQLRSIYGKDDAETISGLAKTRVIFSSPDEETAKWCSDSLGKKEQREIRTNISYGASEVRDGVSLNTHQTMENLVIPTEIMNLHNLECYIKLPFNFPITKTKINVHQSQEIAERFIKDSSTDTFTNNTTNNNEGDDEGVNEASDDNVRNQNKHHTIQETNQNSTQHTTLSQSETTPQTTKTPTQENTNPTKEPKPQPQTTPIEPQIITSRKGFLEGNPWQIMQEASAKESTQQQEAPIQNKENPVIHDTQAVHETQEEQPQEPTKKDNLEFI